MSLHLALFSQAFAKDYPSIQKKMVCSLNYEGGSVFIPPTYTKLILSHDLQEHTLSLHDIHFSYQARIFSRFTVPNTFHDFKMRITDSYGQTDILSESNISNHGPYEGNSLSVKVPPGQRYTTIKFKCGLCEVDSDNLSCGLPR
jgi:hypothetical protein